MKESGYIDAEHPVPRLPGKGLERLAPVRPCVVHENMKRVRALVDFRHERRDARFGRDRAAESLRGTERGELLRDRLAGFRLARGDEDACARAEQSLGADAPETRRAAGHERRAAADGKEVGRQGVSSSRICQGLALSTIAAGEASPSRPADNLNRHSIEPGEA